MNSNHNIFYYIFIYPFIWIYEQLEYVLYVHIYPYLTGKSVAQGWNPKFVKEQNPNNWNPSVPLEIPYDDFIKLPGEVLLDYGIEKGKTGRLYRVYSPQIFYPNPEKAYGLSKEAEKYYKENELFVQEEYKKKITLNPLDKNNVFYYNEFKWNDFDLLFYNIQANVKVLNLFSINIIELLFSFIFFLFILLIYFIFYHLYKINLKLKKAEELLIDNGLHLSVPEEEMSANEMNNLWRESQYLDEDFDVGIEIDYCLYESSLVGLELLILMSTFYFGFYIYDIFSTFFSYYIIDFYNHNTELITYVFSYLFFFLSIFFWLKYKYEKRKSIHRWVEIDYYFSYFLSHYFRTLCWLNVYKLITDAPLFYYILVYTLCMLLVYLACDSCDLFMGWNQEYRIDVFYKKTNMHFWWPRELMNQVWHHLIITILKPIHIKLLYVFLLFLLPLLSLYFYIVSIFNKLHVYINNKYFFWNSKRYTIDEIKEQWKKDRKHNYKEEQNKKGGGLIIL